MHTHTQAEDPPPDSRASGLCRRKTCDSVKQLRPMWEQRKSTASPSSQTRAGREAALLEPPLSQRAPPPRPQSAEHGKQTRRRRPSRYPRSRVCEPTQKPPLLRRQRSVMPVVKETMALRDGVLMERRSSLPPDLSLKSSGSQRGCNLDTQKSIGWLVIGPARPLCK